MSSVAVANYGSVTQADTAATPNTIPLRDNLGGLAVVQMLASELKTSGILTANHSAKTATFTAASNFFYPCDATSAAIVVNLPPVATVSGRLYAVKKIDATNNVTITPSSGELIDGAATKVLSTQYKCIVFYCDGAAWHIIAQF